MARLLLVDDEVNILELLKYSCEKEGYDILAAADGEQALELYKNNRVDLVVLDRMLPGIDGCDVLREIRNRGGETPVIMLTAKSTEEDKLKGFDLGADDYVTKPFSVRELLARIKANLKRSEKNAAKPEKAENIAVYGEIKIDFDKHKIYIGSETVPLTLKEFELLKLLSQNSARVYSREEILDKIWGYEYIGETRTVDVHIRTLRKKLGKYGGLVQTVHGVGYGFDEKGV